MVVVYVWAIPRFPKSMALSELKVIFPWRGGGVSKPRHAFGAPPGEVKMIAFFSMTTRKRNFNNNAAVTLPPWIEQKGAAESCAFVDPGFFFLGKWNIGLP